MEHKKHIWLSLQIAEFQAMARRNLERIRGDADVDELIRALGVCELAARRLHMREAIEVGLIDMPEIKEFDEAKTDSFDD